MTESKLMELSRLGVLGLAAAWLLHPFATAQMYGAGDALWYANMLADFVLQLRAGVFPIFAGQTEFAFNGAVYPLRVAPMYQHLAGMIDVLTGRTLGFITLQHLTVIFCGVAGIFASYLTLCRITPNRRWCATGFAIVYLSCPGILGTIYTQDLYMTWMTVPLAPLAVYGIIRTFKRDDMASQFWLGAPLAALWWAHSPIALWFTIIAAVSQGIRLAGLLDSFVPFRRATIGLVVFAILAQYPFVSVAEIKTPGVDSTVVGSLAHPEKIVEFVHAAFPRVLLPLSDHARELSDLQLGYAFWAILIFSSLLMLRAPRKDLAILLIGSVFLLMLLTPIPWLTNSMWHLLPTSVVRITYYWPMQRFYLILAALLAAAGQISSNIEFRRHRVLGATFAIVLTSGCIWSLWESRQFIRIATERTGTAESSSRAQLLENIVLMDHSYGLFPKIPAYFSNGVVDPRSEWTLRSLASGELLSGKVGRIISSGLFSGTVDANPGILDLGPRFHLEAGRRYGLKFDFARGDVSGILQILGHSMFREYSLPSSGGGLAFGSELGNSRTVDLWTTDLAGDDVYVRFIPMAPGAHAADFENFGSYEMHEIQLGDDPVTITSLIPYKARVFGATASLLETPRVFMPGYVGVIDNVPVNVIRSEEGLAEIAIPSGDHTITLSFKGSRILRMSYWAAVFAWLAAVFAGIMMQLRAKNLYVPSQ